MFMQFLYEINFKRKCFEKMLENNKLNITEEMFANHDFYYDF